jgi:tetratricopeptide (TPR) repeat protein
MSRCALTAILIVAWCPGHIAVARDWPAGRAQTAPSKAAVQERLERIRAELFTRSDRAKEAIRELTEILASDPGSVDAHVLMGIAYRSLGTADMIGEAVAEFRQALALDPAHVPARYFLARVYLDLVRPARAREELEAARQREPGNLQVLALLGETERQLGNPRRSLELNRQVLQSNASFAEARYYMGLALVDLGQRAEGIQELERVVKSGAPAADAYLALGTAYIDDKRLDEAIAVLLEGVRVDAARPDIRVALARAYRSKGLLTRADEQVSAGMPKGGVTAASPVYQQVESDLFIERGLVRLQQGRLDAAAAAFKKVLDMDSTNGPATRYLAQVYLRQGLYAQAADYAARAEKLGFPLPDDQRRLLEARRKEQMPR